ncbi:MAG: FAD-binding oxidoreductase [Promethearchaeota archaeon]
MLEPEVVLKLEKIVGPEHVSSDESILYVYGLDVSDVTGKPDVVVRPRTIEEISSIVKLCADRAIPVIPRGAGTGATGGAVPITGGIVVDLTRMNKIIELDKDNLQVYVQPGVVVDDLNEYLEPHGFFYPVMPGSRAMATMGGVIANDASGMRAFKYGTAKDYLLGLDVVLPDGTIARIGGKTLKNVAGLDLLRLFAGSEGTLGFISGMVLKILPIPPARGVIVVYFDDLFRAGKAVIKIYQSGIIPSAIEILDKSALEAISIYKPDIGVEIQEAMLLFELEGSVEDIKHQAGIVMDLLKNNGAINQDFSMDPDVREKLWSARSVVGASASVVKEGYNRVYQGEDICVPLTRIPETLLKLREIRDKYGLGCIVFGHISIGSLHPAITLRKSNDEDWVQVGKMAREIHEYAISVGGTVTGEHGVGVARKEYMEVQNPEAYEIMKKIKKAIDPKNIMNPGKIFDL